MPILKWATARAFARFFRVLSWKTKYVRRYLTHLEWSLSQLLTVLKVSMCFFRVVITLRSEKKEWKPSPQIRILVPLRGSFQNFWQAPPAPAFFRYWEGWIAAYKSADAFNFSIFFPSIRQNLRPCPQLYCLKNSCHVFSLRPYLKWLFLVSLLSSLGG